MKGDPPSDIGPVHTWPLHLKNVTRANLSAIAQLPVVHASTKTYFGAVTIFLKPDIFNGLVTSRTIKPTKVSSEDIARMIEYGKIEECPRPVHRNNVLLTGVHGTNLFYQPEVKGRRRIITEPHLNAVVAKYWVPTLRHPSRLTTRQTVARSKYCLQIDFQAYYDAIPLPDNLRDKFVFRTKDKYFRLCTIPTGARWSVAVGQAMTWVITDVPTQASVITCIDNVLIAAREGQEADFVQTVRHIVQRMGIANLLTTPPRDELERATDAELLAMALADTIFLGEEYRWTEGRRVVRNQLKTLAKLHLALGKERFTRRTFVGLVSLIMYALHTTRINPSMMFDALRAYRGVYRSVADGEDWDNEVSFLTPQATLAYRATGAALLSRDWEDVSPPLRVSFDERDYYSVIFIDASREGWGALTLEPGGHVKDYQQRWLPNLGSVRGQVHRDPRENRMDDPDMFQARHSAHAEPTAIWKLLSYKDAHGELPDGAQIAVATDHMPIVAAQRKHNGFGGIGRGYHLEALYRYVNDLFHERNIAVMFFFVKGELNPADTLSRNFGGAYVSGIVSRESGSAVPFLNTCFSPLVAERKVEAFCGDRVQP